MILDDGSHANIHQIVTLESSLLHIRDQGLLVIEDTETSFMKFGHFRRVSFVNYLARRKESLYSRNDDLDFDFDNFSKVIHSIEFFTGICALHVNPELCVASHRITNDKFPSSATDFKYENDGPILKILQKFEEIISVD